MLIVLYIKFEIYLWNKLHHRGRSTIDLKPSVSNFPIIFTIIVCFGLFKLCFQYTLDVPTLLYFKNLACNITYYTYTDVKVVYLSYLEVNMLNPLFV